MIFFLLLHCFSKNQLEKELCQFFFLFSTRFNNFEYECVYFNLTPLKRWSASRKKQKKIRTENHLKHLHWNWNMLSSILFIYFFLSSSHSLEWVRLNLASQFIAVRLQTHFRRDLVMNINSHTKWKMLLFSCKLNLIVIQSKIFGN